MAQKEYQVAVSLSGNQVQLATEVGGIPVVAESDTQDQAEEILRQRIQMVESLRLKAITPYTIAVEIPE